MGCLEKARRRRREEAHNRRRTLMARMVIEEELEETGISVMDTTIESFESDAAADEYAISEAELYELMQEVEDELQRDGEFLCVIGVFPFSKLIVVAVEARCYEEAEEAERLQQEQLDAQIAEYEEWEEHANDRVVCPLCFEGEILERPKQFQCERCGVCVDRQHQFGIAALRERLEDVYVEHGSSCQATLHMALDGAEDGNRLVALCDTCNMGAMVL